MITVYIADDEIWIVLGLKKKIQRSGLPFQVIGDSTDGLTAREEILKLRPDVVFTDIRMPMLDGVELMRDLRQAGLSTRIIVISGYAEFDYAQAAIRYGAVDYLLKPIEPEILRGLLEELQKEMEPGDTGEIAEISMTTAEKILEELSERYTEDLTLADLGKKYHLGISNLSMLIKNKLGFSFSEYITVRRMNKARELLADERLSVDEVAQKVGYHDYFYFTKVFKKTQGMSPSKYRQML